MPKMGARVAALKTAAFQFQTNHDRCAFREGIFTLETSAGRPWPTISASGSLGMQVPLRLDQVWFLRPSNAEILRRLHRRVLDVNEHAAVNFKHMKEYGIP